MSTPRVGGNMLTVKNLPHHIKESAKSHQRNDIRFHMFALMFLIEDEKYYFTYV